MASFFLVKIGKIAAAIVVWLTQRWQFLFHPTCTCRFVAMHGETYIVVQSTIFYSKRGSNSFLRINYHKFIIKIANYIVT